MQDIDTEPRIYHTEIKSYWLKLNFKKWSEFNLQHDDQIKTHKPMSIHKMNSLSTSIQALFYTPNDQVVLYHEQFESGKEPQLINEENVNFCIQTFIIFPLLFNHQDKLPFTSNFLFKNR